MNNTSRLSITVILAALLIAVGGLVWFYPRNHSSKVAHVTKSAATKKAKPTLPKLATVSANASAKANLALNSDSTTNGPTIVVSAPHAYVYQPEIAFIDAKFNLNLSPEQLEDFRLKYVTIASRRLEIEADIAQITKKGDNLFEVDIPSYKEAGAKLRDTLSNYVDGLLASVGKTQVAEAVQETLDASNYNWGFDPQKLTIKAFQRSIHIK